MSLKLLLAGLVSAGCLLHAQELTPEQRRFMTQMDEGLGVHPGAVIADIGTGAAFLHPFRIARAVESSGRVFCVDIADPAVRAIRERAQAEGLTNVEAVLGTEADPLLKKDSLDGVLVSNTYHEFSRPDAMLKHIQEALKPGGNLVVSEAYSEKNRHKSRGEQAADHEFSPDLLGAELTKAGFKIVKLADPILPDGDLFRYMVVAKKSD